MNGNDLAWSMFLATVSPVLFVFALDFTCELLDRRDVPARTFAAVLSEAVFAVVTIHELHSIWCAVGQYG